MTERPTIGVVVAVRNGIDTIAAALESVLVQDPAPADIVVLDGASTDGSAERAAEYEGVRVVRQRGLGLGAARNQALREVRGDLLAFCDGDDTWTPGALGCRIAYLSAHPDCDAVIGHIVTVAGDDVAVPDRHHATLGVSRPGYTPGALLAHRHVFAVVGPFDEGLRIGSDSDWFVRLRQSSCRLDVLDDVVLRKGLRGASLSSDVDAYRRELMDVARAYLRRRQSQG